MAEAKASTLPPVEEARGWVGFRLDELGGSSVARVQDVYVDATSGDPVWLVVKVGRFGRSTVVPFRDCAAAAGHVWCPYERERVRGAPAIDPGSPLTREEELELCAHFGIAEGQGRGAELAGRDEGAETARSAGGRN